MIRKQPPERMITEALKHYQDVNGGNDLINTLGATADGRIVKLGDSPCEHQKELRDTLVKHLQEHIPGDEINPDTTINDFYKTLNEYKTSHLETPKTAKKTTFSKIPDPIKTQDPQIKEVLRQVEIKYKNEFEQMDELTETDIKPNKPFICLTTGREPYSYYFKNQYTQDSWVFIHNMKYRGTNKKAFYLDTVNIYQFKKIFEKNKLPLQLPKTITRKSITNTDAANILMDHRNNYETEQFMQDFLDKTVNGKSTKRVAEALGMRIDKLTVRYHEQEVISVTIEDINQFGRWEFDVVVHVSPDPEVYGNPNEMD